MGRSITGRSWLNLARMLRDCTNYVGKKNGSGVVISSRVIYDPYWWCFMAQCSSWVCLWVCVFLGLIELNSQQVCLIDHASASSSVKWSMLWGVLQSEKLVLFFFFFRVTRMRWFVFSLTFYSKSNASDFSKTALWYILLHGPTSTLSNLPALHIEARAVVVCCL